MSVVVKNRNIGVSAQKMRQVCDLIRNKKASDALRTLRFCDKKEISIVLTKLINSGLTIANDLKKYDLENLTINRILQMKDLHLRGFNQERREEHLELVKKQAMLQLNWLKNN